MATDVERVRRQLGEVGEDSTWSDDQIRDLLTEADGLVEAAVASGWEAKAASYAHLVDTSEGTSKRAMSDLHEHALAMASHWAKKSGGSRGLTRIQRIERK